MCTVSERGSFFLPVTVFTLVVVLLFSIPYRMYAMWTRGTEAELIAHSDVIVLAELLGKTRVTLPSAQTSLSLGILRVAEVLKGDSNQTLLLLVLPSSGAQQVSTAIFYHKGQRGLWFLRVRSPGEIGLYLADHPQRFISTPDADNRLEALRNALKTKPRTP